MANGRGSGLVLRPLGSIVSALTSLYQKPSDTIRGIDDTTIWSPLQPVKPFAPPGFEPPQFQYWQGQNLIFTPRSDATYTAADLKALATYPLARICIENVKDTVVRAPWEIQARPHPNESRQQVQQRSKGDPNLVKLNRFFEYPDREHNWQEWLRPILDDMLVIDAASILIRKTFSGQVVELGHIRGEMITRYIDQQGYTPLPPSPAYCQNWWGMPFVDLTTDQLVYKPRNIVPRDTMSSQLYGMSPTEQLAQELLVGIERLKFVLAYYKEGSVPGVVQVVPRGTSPDRIEEAMEWMNSQLAGNLAARNQWRLIQGFNEPGKEDQIIFSKEPLLAGLYDEKHIREVAFGYGTSPQRLMKMIRTEGKGASDSAEVEGTLPWVLWVKGVVDYIIQRKFGFPEYEIAINPYAEPDPLKNAAALTMLVGKAVLTPNEARKRVGEELRPEPEADQLGVITGTGFMPVGIAPVQAGVMTDEKGNIKPHPVTPTPPPVDPNKNNGNATRSGTPVSQEADGGRSTGRNVGTPNGKESLDGKKKITKLEKRLASRIEPDVLTPQSRQADSHIQEAVHKVFMRQKDRAKVAADRLIKAQSSVLQKPFSTVADVPSYVPKSKKKQWLEVFNSEWERHKGDSKQERERIAYSAANGVAGPGAASKYAKILRKATADEAREFAEAVLAELQKDFATLPGEIRAPLESSILSGVGQGLLQIEVNNSALIASANQVAQQYAAERAAELVGMKYDADGNLVENPDAKWAISDTTRDRIREIISESFTEETPLPEIRDAIQEALEDEATGNGIFSAARAALIARTEVMRAQVGGNFDVWEKSGVVKSVKWITSEDDKVCPVCEDNDGAIVNIGQPFPSGDRMPAAHPLCRCVIIVQEVL